ncbi:NAD(P)-dependent dehydrogenase (short-subunit alcohol dehydrogenase family) [Thermocatellispora tengchongensis]|uniref:NAD(P)-dependent dehydrogenase (Short-subunit alcohol dehydrogenase family) n=1 Tax=Thermocatellispora tengchongensis TaxID=1073253 RepID=A0A840PL98_9ACTN|nr:SDR family oxidoreductase [Thermocatellispora tengchongensis]MBB5138571.1 NAD(P)-dependent dehydrogenase (short-subunit alcohol dehydrogenase family) [Thermocatellispora tengchongensis]
MATPLPPLHRSVVVVTGASSGIGRATALEFARRGASLVLAARSGEELEHAAEECRRRGATVLAVPTDVTDETAVRELAARARARFGRIDTWVNCAAVTMFGTVETAPMRDFRQVVDTNLFGYVHGARAALPIFREQGRGVLINVSSVAGEVAQPYTAAYTATKHAVRALSMSLRQELLVDGVRGVHVCTVLPGSIDTPLFQHAADYTGRAVRPMPPVYTPERVARVIVRLARKPRRETYVGPAARFMAWQQRSMPGRTERRMAKMTERHHFARRRAAPATSGNLYTPMPSAVGGGWHGRRKTAMRRLFTAAGLVAAGALLARRRTHAA